MRTFFRVACVIILGITVKEKHFHLIIYIDKKSILNDSNLIKYMY